MPLARSCSTYQALRSSDIFHPRTSASVAALTSAACVGLSRASKALRLTMTAFFFYGFILLVIALPVVFGRRLQALA